MRPRALAAWTVTVPLVGVPLIIAAGSPQLGWREPVYIVAGFAGIVGLCLLLMQSLLIGGALLHGAAAARLHAWSGTALVLAVAVHVGGLWITSPPDVIDVLMFRSPTPFGVWGALAMWAIIAAAILAVFRRRIGLRWFRLAHTTFVTIVVLGTVLHAVLLQGAMGQISKVVLCGAVLAALGWAVWQRRTWRMIRRRAR